MAANGGKHEKHTGVIEMHSSSKTNEIVIDYLAKFRSEMRFMARSDKENIFKEIESHLFEKAESLGGLSSENFHRATIEFGSPKELSKHYKTLYGYSTIFIIILMVIGFFVSLLTVPFSLPGLNKDLIAINNVCLGLSTLFTLLIFIYIIYVGMNFGKWPGMFVGFACLFSRIIMVSILVGLINAQAGDVTVSADGVLCLGFGLVSIFMPIVGFLAGRTTFKFKEGFALEEDL